MKRDGDVKASKHNYTSIPSLQVVLPAWQRLAWHWAAVERGGTAETASVDLLPAPWRGVYGYVCGHGEGGDYCGAVISLINDLCLMDCCGHEAGRAECLINNSSTFFQTCGCVLLRDGWHRRGLLGGKREMVERSVGGCGIDELSDESGHAA